jgi:peptidoglycan/xylan/chitin deacetylase (PgdA/CDA1 family)
MADSVFNITFHGVGDPPREFEPGEDQVWLSVSAVRRVLRAVRGHDEIRITLDDGNRSDAEIMLPELDRFGLTASFFVVAGRIGRPGFLDESSVRAIADAGHEVGLHGMTHRPWPDLSAEELDQELVVARASLATIVQRPITVAACPYGSYNRRILRRLRQLGYERVYTSDGGRSASKYWLQPRTTIGSNPEPSIAAITRRQRGRALAGPIKMAVKRWR